jgi:branched-subunit amino acid transport protein
MYTNFDIWIAIIGMAAVTLATRAAGLVVTGLTLPAWVQRWLGHVPVAVFTALVVPALLVRNATSGPELAAGPGLAAGLVGAVAAWRSRSVIATIVAGLATFWALRWAGL